MSKKKSKKKNKKPFNEVFDFLIKGVKDEKEEKKEAAENVVEMKASSGPAKVKDKHKHTKAGADTVTTAKKEAAQSIDVKTTVDSKVDLKKKNDPKKAKENKEEKSAATVKPKVVKPIFTPPSKVPEMAYYTTFLFSAI